MCVDANVARVVADPSDRHGQTQTLRARSNVKSLREQLQSSRMLKSRRSWRFDGVMPALTGQPIEL